MEHATAPDATTQPRPWGHFNPHGGNRLLRGVQRLGLAHGPVKTWIKRRWRGRADREPVDITYHGVKFRLHPWDNNVESKMLFSSKRRDVRELRALGLLSGGVGVFVDIGANIGYYALTAAGAGAARVLAVEPNPVVFSRLAFNIAANRFEPRVCALPLALGERDGTATLHMPHHNMGGSAIAEASAPGRGVRVPIRPLAAVLAEQAVERVDAMKIDVEGMEDTVLLPFFEQAPRSLWPRSIVMEHSHGDQWRRDVLAWMLSHGYTRTMRTRSNAVLRLTGP